MKELEKSAKNQSESAINGGILLILFTGFSYLCVYQYERGVCMIYKIPENLIKPDLTTNLNYAFKLFSLFLISYLFPYLISLAVYSLLKLKSSRQTARLQIILMLLCILITWVWLGGPDQTSKTTMFFFLLYAAFAIFLPQVWFKSTDTPQTLGQVENISTGQEPKWKFEPASFLYRDPFGLAQLFYAVPKTYSGVMILAFGILMLSLSMGQNDARKETTYQFSTANPGFVVLRRYGEEVILRDYEEKTHTLGSRLLICKDGDQTYTTRYIGSIKPL